MYLEMEGYRMFKSAKDGEEALETLTQNIPDLILLDLMMPKVDGLEVCKQVRKNSKFDRVPVLIFTAADNREAELTTAGADAFISKPYSLSELGKVIANLIKQSHETPQEASSVS
jgi:two-component system response regulator VicR